MQPETLSDDYIGDATYSPDDNKLRLSTLSRLSDEEYARARAAGFRWAPKLEQFICPAWTPAAEDLLLEWCGEIGDERSDLFSRAEDRAERFEGYSDRRADEAAAARDHVDSIANGIPLGQPILVGHHSQKHARRDAKKIEDGMRKALRLWDTSEYWAYRAKAARRHAEFKERPDVRARRIKKLEADRRRHVNSYTPHEDAGIIIQGVISDCWREHGHDERCTRCCEQPHAWVGPKGRGGHWTPVRCLPAIEAGARRWIAHIDKRLLYERAMLEEQGATELLDKPKRPKPKPILNYRVTGGVVRSENEYNRGEEYNARQVEVTKAEYAAVGSDHRGCRLSWDKSHRFRVAAVWHLPERCRKPRAAGDNGSCHEYVAVYLTDSKDHGEPEAVSNG